MPRLFKPMLRRNARALLYVFAVSSCCLASATRAQTAAPKAPDSAQKSAAPRATTHATTPAEGLTKLTVQSGGGRVVIRASDAQTANVHAEAALGGSACGLTASRKSETWAIHTHNSGAGVCDVALIIDVPKKVAIDVTMVSGNLMVSGLVGALSFDITEGNAVVGNQPEHVHAHLGHGSLSAQGLRGVADLTLERGNLQLFLHPQMTGTVTLVLAHGHATVTVPPKAIAVDVTLGHGRMSSNVDTDVNAAIRVVGAIDTGDLKIRSSS